MNIKKDQIKQLAKVAISKSDFARSLGYKYYNGSISKIINKMIDDYNIDTSHFKINGKRKKWRPIEKICPVCGNKFVTSQNPKEETTTCSYACANTFFRSGANHPNWKNKKDKTESSIRAGYRRICFKHHKKKCIICGESKIVEVHHYDEDHNNDDPNNLVPLCPTHHKYIHSRYKDLIAKEVDIYIKNFKAL